MNSICDFNIGDRIEITNIHLSEYQKERLLSMGFTKGSIIEVLRFGPKKGIIVFDVRGVMIALRVEECRNIYGLGV